MVDFPLIPPNEPWTNKVIQLINNALKKIGTGGGSLSDADYGDITVSGSGTVMTIDNDVVTNAKLRNSGPLSVIGRSANSTGDPADISASAASDAVLRESGSTLGFGTVATGGIANSAVTTVKIADSNVTNAKLADPAYDICSFLSGKPAASQVMLNFSFPRSVVFPTSFSGSVGYAETVGAALKDFDIQRNGSSIGKITFSASTTTATFSLSSTTTFSVSDRIKVIAPGSQDATLSDVFFTLKGTKS